MRITDGMLASVVFLGYDVPAPTGHADHKKRIGTGFLVRVPIGDGTRSVHYLVTAKHVQQQLDGNCWARVRKFSPSW